MYLKGSVIRKGASMAKKQYHSRAYHRYFEEFAELRYCDEKGRLRIDRVYVGNYYRRNVSDGRHKLLKIQYAVTYLLALTIFLFAGTRDTQLNGVVYVYVPVTLSLAAMLYFILPLFYNLTAPREMIIRNYRDSSEKLINVSMCAAVLLIVSALATIAGMICVPGQVGLKQFLSIAGFLVSALFLLWLWQTERSLEYETLPPKNTRPARASVVKFRDTY